MGVALRGRIETEVIPSIEAHLAETSRYPESLEAAGATLADLPATTRINYRLVEGGYRVSIDYTPSWPTGGRTNCSYVSEGQAWACHGYY